MKRNVLGTARNTLALILILVCAGSMYAQFSMDMPHKMVALLAGAVQHR